MNITNQYGLTRTIPPDIKLKVRQNSGFGCVICGIAICEYEHVDPEFKDAKEHNSENITLLCPTCHSKVTRKFISKEVVKQRMMNPWCIDNGKCHDSFRFPHSEISISIGSCNFKNTRILTLEDETYLSIVSSGDEKIPLLINAKFCDSESKEYLIITDNEWQASSDIWDLDVSSGSIIIRKNHRVISFRLNNISSNNLSIDRLNMLVNYMHVRVEKEKILLNVVNNDSAKIEISNIIFIGSGINSSAIKFKANGDLLVGSNPLKFESFQNGAIVLKGSGNTKFLV
ncbi:MAG: HNH endonuclease signature motif containing protein [Melioribacteraceae bacterium]